MFNPARGQYGKAITVYPTNKAEMDIVIEEAMRMNRENINGLPWDDFKAAGANVQYERAVPETGNLVRWSNITEWKYQIMRRVAN